MNRFKVLQNNAGADLIVRPLNQSNSQPALPPELAQIAQKLFTHPFKWHDGIVRTPLVWVSEYFRKNGVAIENIQAGLLIYLALNSVRLGYPLSLVLSTEDTTIASHLLFVCKKIAPENSFIEIQELKAEELYQGQQLFRDKVVVCQDIFSSRKAIPDLLKIITQGYTTRPVPFKSRYGHTMQTVSAKHPKALIGIETASRESHFNHPSIIKVPVCNNCHQNNVVQPMFSNPEVHRDNITVRTIATIFERLRNRQVSIPYLNQVIRAVVKQKPEHARDKLGITQKVISLCSIINDPPQPTYTEHIAKYIKAKPDDVEQMIDAEELNRDVLPGTADILEANKIDLYFAALLFDDVIGIESDSFTEAQVKVFEAVRSINFSKLNAAVLNQNDLMGKLSMLPRFSQYWAYMHEIMKIVNKPNLISMTVPDIEKAIAKLKKMNKLRAKKGVSTKGEGYFILVPEIKSYLKLPKRLAMEEHAYEKQPIKVLNPVTGTVEEL